VHRFGFNEEFLMRLSDFIKLLPNVKPLKARAKLKEWRDEIYEQIMQDTFADKEREIYEVNIGKGIVLSSDDFEHIFYGDEFSATKITPHGAEILIKIYCAGFFELTPRKGTEKVPNKGVDYSKSEHQLLIKQKLAEEAENEKSREYATLIDCPQNIKPENFTYSLLNDVFMRHIGLKAGCYSMNIGGIEVTKYVHMHTSNSGKNRDSEVTFTWVDPDGNKQKIEKQSSYSQNRRNDPDRNWGLHE